MDKYSYVTIHSIDEEVEPAHFSCHGFQWITGSLHVAVTIFLGISTLTLATLLYFQVSQPSCHEKWSTYCEICSVWNSVCCVDSMKLPYFHCCRRCHRRGGSTVHSVIRLRTKARQMLLLMQLGTICIIVSRKNVCSPLMVIFLITEVSTVGYFRISPDDLDRIGGDPNSVRWPDELGGGYVGFLESLHQIHCVVSFASLSVG